LHQDLHRQKYLPLLLPNADDMRKVARGVGELNRILPKRRFVLIGPGRWGSRGDIEQGVGVSYADICNAAALVEVAVSGSEYAPDLSFGTHFFQDLVESEIRYVPIYPEHEGASFNHGFLVRRQNEMPELIPDYAYLGDVLRVVDVGKAIPGSLLHILLNADLEEAVGVFAEPRHISETAVARAHAPTLPPVKEREHWQWRYEMAERIAQSVDPQRFGVTAIYILGSVKNGTAGPASDIDLIVHHSADDQQLHDLELWMEGWSASLDELNFRRTGYRSNGLLDVHYVTDEDIAHRTSFAAKIGAATDPAEALPLAAGRIDSG
jgi:hypothetical protein